MRIPPLPKLKYLEKEPDALSFLIKNGVLYDKHDCKECGTKMVLSLSKGIFRCPKKDCRKETSVRLHSFFDGHKMKCFKILFIAYLWLIKTPFMSIVAASASGTSQVSGLQKKFRELIASSLEVDDTVIGGPGIVVEIDESKFGKRKYNRGHRVEGVWIVGGVERTRERKSFLVQVKDRKADILTYIITKHVREGSIIYTDLWKGYNRLSRSGYEHSTVNHSENFKDPVTGTHTNTIEGTWNGLKMQIKPRCRVKDKIDDHLLEFLWRRKNSKNLWEGFINALKDAHYE